MTTVNGKPEMTLKPGDPITFEFGVKRLTLTGVVVRKTLVGKYWVRANNRNTLYTVTKDMAGNYVSVY